MYRFNVSVCLSLSIYCSISNLVFIFLAALPSDFPVCKSNPGRTSTTIWIRPWFRYVKKPIKRKIWRWFPVRACVYRYKITADACVMCQTCAQLHEHVDEVDEIRGVVEDKPDDDALVSELPEHGPCDDDEQVVQDRHRDDSQPAVVRCRRRIHHQRPPETAVHAQRSD